jgi:hypothetical protein
LYREVDVKPNCDGDSTVTRLRLNLILFLWLALFATGCTRSPGGVAASNIPLEQGGYSEIGPVRASDCKVNLFGILPVSGSNRVGDAVRSALRKESGADALINISIDLSFKFFILWSQTCTEIHATAVRLN